jgi:hypothetical protein
MCCLRRNDSHGYNSQNAEIKRQIRKLPGDTIRNSVAPLTRKGLHVDTLFCRHILSLEEEIFLETLIRRHNRELRRRLRRLGKSKARIACGWGEYKRRQRLERLMIDDRLREY